MFGGRIQNSVSLTLVDDYEHTFQASTRSGEHRIIGPWREKTCLRHMAAIKKGADQPAHLRSLISAFVIRLLESVIKLNFNVHTCLG